MTGDEMVIEILRGIRADLADLRSEVRATNVRLDETRVQVGGEIAGLRTEVGSHIATLGTAMQELAVQQRFVVRYTKAIAERESPTPEDLADLRARVERLEHKVGLAP